MVVLPAPLGPRNPVIVPRSSANDRSSTARTSPNRFVKDSATTTGAAMRSRPTGRWARSQIGNSQRVGHRDLRGWLEPRKSEHAARPQWASFTLMPSTTQCTGRAKGTICAGALIEVEIDGLLLLDDRGREHPLAV